MRTKKILLIALAIFTYAFIIYVLYTLKHILQQDMSTIGKIALALLCILATFLGGFGVTIGICKLWKLLS